MPIVKQYWKDNWTCDAKDCKYGLVMKEKVGDTGTACLKEELPIYTFEPGVPLTKAQHICQEYLSISNKI